MRFTEYDVSIAEEKHIVTGLIVSSDYCKRIKDYLDLEYFTNKYLKTLAEWSLAFYDEHEKAPFKHINDIFESFKKDIKEADAELIDDLLTNLGNQYSGEDINVDFLVNEAEEYFRRRELEIHINNISVLKEKGDLDLAEEEIARFNKISIKLDENVYINPGDDETRKRIYDKRDRQEKSLFKLPGDIGLFLGKWKLGDVIGITAPAKRGKSFFLSNIQKHAILNNVQTLKWSIEMTDVEELERFDKMFYPTVETDDGYYMYPEFDCIHNQTGNCGDRLSTAIVKESEKAPVIEHPDHVVCTKCMNDPRRFRDYACTTYKMEIYREQSNALKIRKKLKKWNAKLNKYSRIVVRPKYSLTYDMMMRDIDILHSRYGYIPKVLLLDYIDILNIASKFEDYKLEDEKWKLTQKVAGVTGCLFITPTQGNKDAHNTSLLKSTDQAGFYGKSRHVNNMYGINQTAIEKRAGIWRINKTDSRSSVQDVEDFCFVLQDLRAGQMHLSSYWPSKFDFFGRRELP